MKHYNIPIFVAHYGCPHTCVFCNQYNISGCREDITKEKVIKEIEDNLKSISLVKEEKSIEVAFFGGSFTAIEENKQKELLELVKPYIEDNIISGIRISTRPDYINERILKFLKNYNVSTIEIGAQSFDEKVLFSSERGHNSKDIISASEMIKKFNIKLGIQLMPGLPDSSIDTDIRDALETIKLKPDFVRIYPTVVISNTKLEKMYKKNIYKPMTIEEAVNRVLKMYLLFEKNNIQIIRVGLQPSEDIREEGIIVAGPFHPAFRELIESEIYYKFFESKIKENIKKVVYINIYDISRVKGINKINEKRLKKYFTMKVDKNLKKGELKIENNLYLRGDIIKILLQ